MKLGLCLPHESFNMAGKTPSADDVIRLARLAEDLGYHSIWVVDHFCYLPYEDKDELGIELSHDLKGVKFGAWECWTTAAAIAMATKRVEIGTLVANTGYRNPALLARMAETVDAYSHGRLILGLGAGDFPSEHTMFGYPWERRVGRFEEALKIIRPMMHGEAVTFKGEFYSVTDAELLPRGQREKGAPLLIGVLGRGPRMKRLVAQYADQWNCWMGFRDNRAPAYVEFRDAMHAACEKHGRDPSTLVKNVTVRICPAGEPPWVKGIHPIMGSTTEIADQLNQYAELGVSHINTFLNPNNERGFEALAPVLEAVRQ
jgi:alkanesulfonate monooxygenase SsuD/methylene tetrahydromethanopterin reductase-like flavin-dependent oxidoreductase (luciferase family)